MYLKEWNETQMKIAEKSIRRFLTSRKFDTNKQTNAFACRNTFKQLDDVVGFVYTLIGRWAGYGSCCNEHIYLDVDKRYYIYEFIMDEKGYVYAYCLDYDSNELVVMI